MTSDELSQIQNPVKVLALNSKLHHLHRTLGVLAFTKSLGAWEKPPPGMENVIPAAIQTVERIKAKLDAELAKPKLCKRAFRLLRGTEAMPQLIAQFLFPASCPDHFVRSLIASWGADPAKMNPETVQLGLTANPVHLYRNPRHVLASLTLDLDVSKIPENLRDTEN